VNDDICYYVDVCVNTKAINCCRVLSMLVAMFTLAAASHSFSIVLFSPYEKSFYSLFSCINIFYSQCTGIHGLATYVFVCLSISCASCEVLFADAVALSAIVCRCHCCHHVSIFRCTVLCIFCIL